MQVVGIRHHSPACARLVEHVIRARRPRHVLIEGPADMNARLSELMLRHRLPVAIYSYCRSADERAGCWSPLCDYSPEWVALQTARAVDADARFMDLPAWHPDMRDVTNRFSDHDVRAASGIEALCQQLGVDDLDALWDHLFEQKEGGYEHLLTRLRTYFEALRDNAEASERERFMARHIAAAARHGSVVAICGGWHQPMLERLWPTLDASDWPVVPEADGARVGSYLVPYSFHRLDSFTGYEAGMPSPEYYQRVWEVGLDAAAESMLGEVATRLRERRQRVSAADLIAASTTAEGLRALRGHAALARVDLLDGMAAALLKDALQVPFPWTRRGRLRAATDPLLVEMVAAFRGNRRGELHPDTPRPALLHDVFALLEAHDLDPRGGPRRIDILLTEAADLTRSRVLHRLRVLGVRGFSRTAGPRWATEAVLRETWALQMTHETEADLIEAAVYGSSLEDAAAARLQEALAMCEGHLAAITALLGDAVAAALLDITSDVLWRIERAVAAEPSLRELGAALLRLLGLWRHDALLGAAHSAAVGRVITAAFARGTWLFDAVQGADASEEDLAAMIALRDTARHGTSLPLQRDAWLAVLRRRAVDVDCPVALRGAALGSLWSSGQAEAAEAPAPSRPPLSAVPRRLLPQQEAVAALRRLSQQPQALGDFMRGLCALARDEVGAASDLLCAVDAAIRAWSEDDFLIALPSLRLAFNALPPAEKERLAQAVLALHEAPPSHDLLHLPHPVGVLTAAMRVETQVDDTMRRFGLLP